MNNEIKNFRIQKNLTVEKMIEYIGVSSSLYYKIEQGERNPSFGFLKKLKAAFPDVDINPIFEANHQN